jgi:hypothetical protein
MDDKVLQLQAMYPDLSADAARRKLGETGGDLLAAVEYFLEHGTADVYASPGNTGGSSEALVSLYGCLHGAHFFENGKCISVMSVCHIQLGTLVG